MAETKTKKKWYFITWEELRPTSPRFSWLHAQNTITDQDPVDWLIEARQASRHRVNLLWWTELDATSSQIAAWRKKLDD